MSPEALLDRTIQKEWEGRHWRGAGVTIDAHWIGQ